MKSRSLKKIMLIFISRNPEKKYILVCVRRNVHRIWTVIPHFFEIFVLWSAGRDPEPITRFSVHFSLTFTCHRWIRRVLINCASGFALQGNQELKALWNKISFLLRTSLCLSGRNPGFAMNGPAFNCIPVFSMEPAIRYLALVAG
jgi:hypothetical protein